MTREEAIKGLKVLRKDFSGYKPNEEMFDMAIEALERERTDEWCTDCKEYDTEKKCCPRFNRVIRGAMKREPSDDLISRAEATDLLKRRLYETAMNNDRVPVMDAGDLYADIAENRIGIWMSELPSADRPRGEWIKATESTCKCSLCNGIMYVESNYCPFCGADMRGDNK